LRQDLDRRNELRASQRSKISQMNPPPAPNISSSSSSSSSSYSSSAAFNSNEISYDREENRVYELLRRLEEKGKSVLVMAPTGKAALQAGGYTLQSKEEKLGDSMKGNAFLKSQKRFENIVAVIIDEYSMVPGAHIAQVDDRL
jgi:hypothetical protein